MFTMSAVFQATQALLNVGEREEISDQQAELALRFWTLLGEIIPEWRQVIAGETSPAALRPNYVHVHSVTLLAIGRAGAALMVLFPDSWQANLVALGELDWSRRNPAWEGRAMMRGRMSKTHASIQLTTNLLKLTLGLPLAEKEKELEKVLER
jgi:DNA sulfur modification protein DndB